MRTFRKHLQEELQDDHFRKVYQEEKQLAQLSLRLHAAREGQGLSNRKWQRKPRFLSSSYPSWRMAPIVILLPF